MKTKNYFILGAMAIACATACESDADIFDTDKPDLPDQETPVKYPAGSIVWKKDTVVILNDHFLVNRGEALYIEEGAKIVTSNPLVKPEIVVLGSLYSMGTADNPVLFTVEDSSKEDRFSRNWGGIICGYESEELFLNHTIIEYACAETTEESLSFQHQLFKTVSGSGVPAVHFCNIDGRMIIQNSTFRNNAEDHIYITGGQSIVRDNKFIYSGFDGGEAINYKSDCLADISGNLIYDANSNAFKMSNAGFLEFQSHIFIYNNTVVNTGWRRPSVKGGSTWLESMVLVEIYNNLMVDCRWGIKDDVKKPSDALSIYTPNFYFSSTAIGVAQMQLDPSNGILSGANDIMSVSAGDKNPMFTYFPQQANVNINVASNVGDVPAPYDEHWDFSLMEGSPALSNATTAFTPHFTTNGISMNGLVDILSDNRFYSPAPANYFGAYGKK